MSYKQLYEQLKEDIFSAVRKEQFKYYRVKENGRKIDVVRNIISELDLDDEYMHWIFEKHKPITTEQQKTA